MTVQCDCSCLVGFLNKTFLGSFHLMALPSLDSGIFSFSHKLGKMREWRVTHGSVSIARPALGCILLGPTCTAYGSIMDKSNFKKGGKWSLAVSPGGNTKWFGKWTSRLYHIFQAVFWFHPALVLDSEPNVRFYFIVSYKKSWSDIL